MQNLLKTYRTYPPNKVCFLSSAYVDQILSEYKGYATTMMICNVLLDEIHVDTAGLELDSQTKIDMLVRLRIRMIDPETQDYTYHVNLLIFNMQTKTIEHFEPFYVDTLGNEISRTLREHFKKTLPDFKFQTLDFHPQKEMNDECKNMGLCVAHVIRFAICHLYCTNKKERVTIRDEEDIYRFASAIEAQY